MSYFDEAMSIMKMGNPTEEEYIYVLRFMGKEGFANNKIRLIDDKYYVYKVGARLKDKHKQFIDGMFSPLYTFGYVRGVFPNEENIDSLLKLFTQDFWKFYKFNNFNKELFLVLLKIPKSLILDVSFVNYEDNMNEAVGDIISKDNYINLIHKYEQEYECCAEDLEVLIPYIPQESIVRCWEVKVYGEGVNDSNRFNELLMG